MQKEGYKGLTGLGREKPCKKNGGKRQKNWLEPWPHRIERKKSWKTFEKVSLNTWKSVFIKILYAIFDQSKNRFDRSKGQKQVFVVFQPNFFKGFCHLRPVRPLYPSFFLLFSLFMHYIMHFRENFKPWNIWGFWCFKPFLSQLINGFLLWDNIKLFLVN